jgi:uncharacterized SAM-binding protein YcdF (DUF218 family)
MLKNQDIVCFSSIDWDFIWQIPQESMNGLAANGNRVLFIDNLGVRMPVLKDRARIKSRIFNWFKGISGIRQERKNLFVFSPIILPFPYLKLARCINKHILLFALRKWFKVMNFNNPLVFVFLPSPIVLDLISELDNKLTVYYCADSFSSSSSVAKRIRKSEMFLLKKADLVFVTSNELKEYCLKQNHSVYLLSSGVNFELFDKFNKSEINKPQELTLLKTPIVGYIGGIHKWVDLLLLKKVAMANPEMSFVFIGPAQEDPDDLLNCPNVHFLGAKEHSLLPQYIKFFDIALIPYVCREYTNNVYPVKLNEYFSMGKPIVSTALPEIESFNKKYGNLVYVAKDADGFSRCILQALKENSPELINKRIRAAEENSWNKKLKALSLTIEKHIEIKSRDRQARWKKNLLLFYRNARRRLVGIALVAFIIYLLLFYTNFVWFLAKPLKIAELPRSSDAIVVFAGGVGETGKATQGYEERVEYAVELYKKGFAENLIFSSGYMYHFREPVIMKALAVSLGVPSESVNLEDKARNTYENVILTKEIMDRNKWRKVLVVSAPYHMRRVALVMRKNAPGIEPVFTPVPESIFYRHGVTKEGEPDIKQLNMRQLRAFIHEYLGIILYWLKGWI